MKSVSRIDKATLQAIGATDVLEISGGVQTIFSAKAILYKNNIIERQSIDE